MATNQDLSAMLKRYRPADLAKEAGVCARTICRIRDGHTGTTLATAEKLLSAMRKLRALKLP